MQTIQPIIFPVINYLYSHWNIFIYCLDINECERSNDCMHQCKNKEGSFNCSCNDFFEVDQKDWRKCVGMHRISFSWLFVCNRTHLLICHERFSANSKLKVWLYLTVEPMTSDKISEMISIVLFFLLFSNEALFSRSWLCACMFRRWHRSAKLWLFCKLRASEWWKDMHRYSIL